MLTIHLYFRIRPDYILSYISIGSFHFPYGML
nr:MAG TPA: hypothetical protein [Caudoviricetes sp.]